MKKQHFIIESYHEGHYNISFFGRIYYEFNIIFLNEGILTSTKIIIMG
jgi:hypothetical protein